MATEFSFLNYNIQMHQLSAMALHRALLFTVSPEAAGNILQLVSVGAYLL
jgi:hypothetical protein